MEWLDGDNGLLPPPPPHTHYLLGNGEKLREIAKYVLTTDKYVLSLKLDNPKYCTVEQKWY